MTGWENIDPVELARDDIVLSRYGPARVRGWRWRPPEGVTVDVELLSTGATMRMRGARVLRATATPDYPVR